METFKLVNFLKPWMMESMLCFCSTTVFWISSYFISRQVKSSLIILGQRLKTLARWGRWWKQFRLGIERHGEYIISFPWLKNSKSKPLSNFKALTDRYIGLEKKNSLSKLALILNQVHSFDRKMAWMILSIWNAKTVSLKMLNLSFIMPFKNLSSLK